MLVVAAAVVLALAVPTAAVTASEDDLGGVVLAAHDGPNGQYATVQNGELSVAFEELNDDAVTTADNVFTITADDDVDCIGVWVELDGAVVYRGEDPADRMDGESDAVALAGGETVAVGFEFDTETPLPSSDNMTIHAEEADGCAEQDQSDTGGAPPTLTPPNGSDGGASFAVNLSVERTGVPGERNATVTVENTGDVEGTFVANLTVDGTVVATRSVTVPAGETRRLTFTYQFKTAGTYQLGVGDSRMAVTVDDAEVAATPDIVVTSVSVDDRNLEPGDSTAVVATLENTGDESGERTVELVVAGVVVDTVTVTVDPGETRTVRFERTFETPGVYDVAVGGVTGGSVVVRAGDTTATRVLDSNLASTLFIPVLVGLLLALRRRQSLAAVWRRR